MEKVPGLKDDKDLVVLNKLLAQLDRNKADVRYLLSNRIRPISDNYTTNIDDVAIRCDTAGKTVTLPKSNATGKIYWVKNASSGNITIAAAPGDMIEGAPSMTFASKVCRQVIDISKGEWDVV